MLIVASWTSLYTNDLSTRSSLPSHRGTTWFDDADAERKTVRYLASLVPKPPFPEPENGTRATVSPLRLSHRTTSFLDLGTGNGSQLFALRRAGWSGLMVGVDYEPASVELARSIWQGIVAKQNSKKERAAAGRGREGTDEQSGEDGWNSSNEDDDEVSESHVPSVAPISFETYDILSPSSSSSPPPWMPSHGFDVVLDKGTFDAISLSGDIDEHGRRPCQNYAAAVKHLVRKGGMLLVTSCNWTEKELEEWMCGNDDGREDDRLEVCGRVPYPRFTFGGIEGQSVAGVAFRRW